jgi:DNA-binding MarR family transcriptional regulator
MVVDLRTIPGTGGTSMSRTTRSDLPVLDHELQFGYLIHDVSRLRRKAFDRHIKGLNVTRSQWWVLAYVSRKDGMAQTQLAEQLEVGKVAIGGVIDRLEQSGLARRVPDEQDRRIKRIFLTPRGRRLVERLRAASREFNERVLQGISRAHLGITAAVLRRVKANVISFIAAAGPDADERARDAEIDAALESDDGDEEQPRSTPRGGPTSRTDR